VAVGVVVGLCKACYFGGWQCYMVTTKQTVQQSKDLPHLGRGRSWARGQHFVSVVIYCRSPANEAAF
jgi:hypothetical protein